jgi:hypothetical protein
MTTQTEVSLKNHQRAVRFFWCLLIGATAVSLIGNVVHVMLPYIPSVGIQVGAAAVPPVALLAAVYGIALAVRAGASGPVYCWAVSAVAVIGLGAFAVSFMALSGLMQAIGYSSATAWMFTAIIDTTVAVSTLMLVALGDKPARRGRSVAALTSAEKRSAQVLAQTSTKSAKAQITPAAIGAVAQTAQGIRAQNSVSAQPDAAYRVHDSAQSETTQVDADFASELVASGATTQPVETVIAVLTACLEGASINAAAKAVGINYRTAQRIVQAANQRQERPLLATG